MVLRRNLVGGCPGGWCDYLVQFSELLVVLLLVDAFIFLVTLIPPLFSWKTKKPDSRRRIFFAAFACLTFYFWLIILAIHSLYCFGFLAHAGPCNTSASTSPTSSPAGGALLAPVDPLQGLQPTVLPGVAKLNATVRMKQAGSTLLTARQNQVHFQTLEQSSKLEIKSLITYFGHGFPIPSCSL